MLKYLTMVLYYIPPSCKEYVWWLKKSDKASSWAAFVGGWAQFDCVCGTLIRKKVNRQQEKRAK